ncbi:hypothetical protein [Marinobacter sp.]|uniref:hypothetical protein n=1 Tax=Marinobacter sp. TaxID=50741 RepID=UPI002352042B|nr:hypothetical protein [Marinobacter sp.]
MNFLCPNHHQQFAGLPLEERKDLWLSWMKQACACSEEGQWQGVLSFSGSAFDLACLHGAHEESRLDIELTLSAILVSRVLFDLADWAGSERVIFRALEHLLDDEHGASFAGREGVEECVAVLMDTSRQSAFFADYLNWSTLAFARRDRVPVHTTLH